MHTDPRTKVAARDCGPFIESLLISRFAVCRDYGSGNSVLQGFGPAIPIAPVTVPVHQPGCGPSIVARPRPVGPAPSVVVHHAADAPVGVGTYEAYLNELNKFGTLALEGLFRRFCLIKRSNKGFLSLRLQRERSVSGSVSQRQSPVFDFTKRINPIISKPMLTPNHAP